MNIALTILQKKVEELVYSTMRRRDFLNQMTHGRKRERSKHDSTSNGLDANASEIMGHITRKLPPQATRD